MFTCPKCNTFQLATICMNCPPVKVGETYSRRHEPEYKGKWKYTLGKPFRSTPEEQKTMVEKTVARKRTDEMLDDPDFDYSLDGSRKRLEMALAVGSATALSLAKCGVTNPETADIIAKFASMYRTLANTMPAKKIEELSDEELQGK